MVEFDPEQIKREQERQESLSKQSASAKELASTYEKIAKAKGKINDEDRATISIARQLSEFSSNIAKSIQKRLTGTASIKDLSKGLKELELDLIKNQNKYQETLNKINDDKAKALSAARNAARVEYQQKSLLKDASLEELRILDEIDNIKAHGSAADKALLPAKRIELMLQRDIVKAHKDKYEKAIKEKEEQKNLVKLLGEAAETHKKTLEEQEKEIALTKELIAQKKKEEISDILKKQFRIDEIKHMFTLAGFFKIILDAAFRFNAISVNIGKNLGYGADQADRVTNNLVNIAQNSDNLNVTLKSLGEAMSDLNSSTGGVAEYSADTLKTQIMLTKQFGLTGEEAAGIYKSSVLTGKATSQVNDEMVAAFASTRNMVKGSANFKATMAEAAKVSGQLAINFKNNPAEITKAVVQAQILGTTLAQTTEQGKQLLNFESSIQNELEAELLTGQQMNLERARAAALMGDQVTVMKELNNQGMTLEKFQNMNVLAQESFAKALGLSADQLSEQLRKQKIAQEQGKSLAEITADEAKDAEKRQAVQDKFNQAIEKLQDIIGNLVAGPFGQLLEVLSNILNVVGLIGKPFGLIGMLIDKIAGSASGLGSILKGILGIVAAIAIFTDPLMALGSLALIGGAIAGIQALIPGENKFATGGIVTGEINNATIGEAGPEAVIPLNSPKADKMLGGSNIDLSPMIAAINEVKASVDKLYSKDTTINMDGKRVGTTLTQGSYKVA